MLETNIRLVKPGASFLLWVRRASVEGQQVTPAVLQRACTKLFHHPGLLACPAGDAANSILVVTNDPVPDVHVKGEDWEICVRDAGEPAFPVSIEDAEGRRCLPALIERALLNQISQTTRLWRLESPRIWYEPEPFSVIDGIAAYRRYELSVLLIEDAGLGVAVDVSTAFFTTDSLAYFFDNKVDGEERRRRGRRFAELTGRQERQKGTLMYDNGRSRSKCYFEAAPVGVTCATTGRFRVKGQSFESLLEYYRATNPKLSVSRDTLAVQVSFAGMGIPAWVAADRVVARVMNERLPSGLRQADKIRPEQRRQLVLGFWQQLGPRPFGRLAIGLFDALWSPPDARTRRLELPDLVFGRETVLRAPTEPERESYRMNFRSRLEYLDEAGAYYTPPTVDRSLFVAFPTAEAEAAKRLADDLTRMLGSWSGLRFSPVLVPYHSVTEGVQSLQAAQHTGTVVFVLNQEPAAYHSVAFELNHWRVKRITDRSLRTYHQSLLQGAWDRRRKVTDGALGRRRWNDYVLQSALEVFQLLDGVPFRLEQAGAYQGQLMIDVGRDRRSFALSFMIARPESYDPSFHIHSAVQLKPDHQQEAINRIMLADRIVELCAEGLPHGSDPLSSLIVMRDGRFVGEEVAGVTEAVNELMTRGLVTPDAQVDLVNIGKETLRSVRVWERKGDNVDNVLEGLEVRLSSNFVLVVSTGASTLTTGTAQPYALSSCDDGTDLDSAAVASFASAQLNWSSPRVAQRLPLVLKRTDEDLAARASQEIRQIR